MARENPEQQAIISGVGQSAVARRQFRHPVELTLDACLAAIEDAGLTRDDIDGLSTYPGQMGSPWGFAGPGSPVIQDALRLNLNWHRGGMEGPAQLSAVIDAVTAVSMGLARHVLVYRTVTEGSAAKLGRGAGSSFGGGGGGGRVRSGSSTTMPYHSYSAANWIAWYATRYMYEYGLTKEQLGQIALNGRRNAALNPNAVYTDPMTLDDYLESRPVTTPLSLYDCDVPCDGSTAFVVSHRDHARDLPNPAVQVLALGSAIKGRPQWEHWEDMTTMSARDAGAHLWSRTDLTPADVDTAQLYDGFSFLAIVWLEALRLCGRGEAGEFLEGGKRIALDGDLPLNTWGGQLSGGRLHGFGFPYEATLQLRGSAGERQLDECEIAVAGAGGGPLAGCLLLGRMR